MHTRNGRAARELRRTEAADRQALRDKRSDEDQLHRLIDNGHGHCKEACRLADAIQEA